MTHPCITAAQDHSRITPDIASARRVLATAALALLACTPVLHAEAGYGFDYQELQYRAKALASRPFEPQTKRVPDWLLPPKINYDQHRDIRFRTERSLWREDELPFQVQFFHPGWLFHETVQIHELDGKRELAFPFSRRFFDYGKNSFNEAIPRDMGYAGFRIHYALNKPEYLDELAVFLGASYFRALGKGQHYGLSARGLAIDTAAPTGEEFPIFREFWLQRPAADAKETVVFALLDSKRVAGAYRFVIRPGADTVMRVRATIYMREQVSLLGIAPFSSMFWHGENSGTTNGDYRPEVHDSDGLLVHHASGEWLWRPLLNPQKVNTAFLSADNVRGFGLLQRDRDFDHYQDLEAYYHQRPSVWVQPVGDWGRGSVTLVELPTPDETMDNIVAFWAPEKCPPVGEPYQFEYDLHWLTDMGRNPPAGYVTATRPTTVMGRPDLKRFVVDFNGGTLGIIPAGVEGLVSVGEGATLEGVVTQKNNYTGGWRLAFEIKPDGSNRPIELRAFLRKGNDVMSETWSYRWQP
jgi:glucans biosynthesis protein